MTNIGIQRKRSRSIENEFGEEFFPLSKRINNLELTFSQIIINNNNHQQHLKDHPHHLQPELQAQHVLMQHHQQQSQHQANSNHYNPELSIDQNPHYFYKNNILYDLYIERLRRNEEANKSST